MEGLKIYFNCGLYCSHMVIVVLVFHHIITNFEPVRGDQVQEYFWQTEWQWNGRLTQMADDRKDNETQVGQSDTGETHWGRACNNRWDQGRSANRLTH